MKTMRSIAEKGYGYYLTLKISKAIWCPFWFVIFTGIILLYMAIYPLVQALTTWKECVIELPQIYNDYIFSRRWYTGFSPEYYDMLYNPKRRSTALPPLDKIDSFRNY